MSPSPRNSKTTASGRTYTWKGEEFPSVTTVLGSLPKPALKYWAAKEAATYAVYNVNSWAGPSNGNATTIEPYDYDEAINDIKKAPFRKRDKKADVGTIVHAAIERHLGGGDLGEGLTGEEVGYAHAALSFLDHYDPQIYLQPELTVYSRKHRYAGTLDLLGELSGHGMTVIDFKTSKTAYPDYGAQIAAYALSEFAGIGEDEVAMPPVELGLVVVLNNEGEYSAFPFRDLDEWFEMFLAAQAIWDCRTLKVGKPL